MKDKFIESLKIQGKTDTEIITELAVSQNIKVEEAFNKVKEYNRKEELRKKVEDLSDNFEAVSDFNEYGIAMIPTDKDW